MHCTLEVCIDSTASALAAKRGGADRLELCADLIIGGTTPSPALLRQVKAETGLPVRALIRPRFGDFCYDRYELAQMAECAAELVAAGADGIVTGVLTPAGALDTDALRPIYAAARQAAEKAHRTVDCTLHRAFDVCCDPFAALEAAKQLGLATILTSGQAASAGCCPAAAAGGSCRAGSGNIGRRRRICCQHPRPCRPDWCPGVPPFRQAGAGQPHDLPAAGRPHGSAGLFGV
mgnify:CR=1 FL=1